MDISFCKGTDCPLKENCLRFEPNENSARVSFRQSWLLTPPVLDGECEMQIKIQGASHE